MKRFVLLTAALVILAPLALATVYKVVDDNGKVTYTDKAPAANSSKPLTLPPINTQPGLEVPLPEAVGPESAATPDYRRVEIIQPQEGTTVPPGQLDLVVQVRLTPELQPGHLISFVMDGQSVANPAATTSIRLDNLNRGTHQITAEVLDERGRFVTSSRTVEFYVQRSSRLAPTR